MPSKNKKLTTAVILSSHTIGLGVIRALGQMGVPITVIYYEKIDMGHRSKYVKKKIFSPHPENSEDEFIDLLIKQASTGNRNLLVPADDATLLTVSKHKDFLSQYYEVACSGWDVTKQFLDKKYTYNIADQLGVPTPKTITPKSNSDLRE